MIRLPHTNTSASPPAVKDGVRFTIESLRVQGPAHERLRKQFGAEMRNFLDSLSESATGTVRIGMANDTGLRRRDEDSVVAMLAHLGGDDPLPVVLAAVADGIGGAPDGDVASAIAIQTLTEKVVSEMEYPDEDKLAKLSNEDNVLDLLQEAIYKAHAAIKSETREGGTTLTAALVIGHKAYLAHIGDSRAYLLNNRQKGIEQITQDHRLVKAWEALGVVKSIDMAHHPLGHVIIRSLGRTSGDCKVDLTKRALQPDSRLLLVTDGVSDVLSQNGIFRTVSQDKHPNDACERLVRAAIGLQTQDDVSAVMVELTA